MNFFAVHPALATIAGLCSIGLAEWIRHAQWPPFVLESGQLLAYAGTVTMAAIAVHGWWTKRKKK